MKTTFKVFVSVFVISLFSISVTAQTKVSFNLDMKQPLKDSLFIPIKNKVKLVGNIPPLNGSRIVYLYDTEPIDSVYTVEIDFPRRYEGQILDYNFVVQLQNENRTENGARTLKLFGKEIILPAMQFGAFAW